MGRPSKTTVDYFPHFTTSGKTLFTLENAYGNDGYAFWFKLLELLGSTSGHCYEFSKKPDWLYLLAKTKVDEETARDMLDLLADLGAIDKKLLSGMVIFSQNFLDHLRPVYGKRGTEMPGKPSFCAENSKVQRVSAPETRQSKVKESKGNKSSEKSPYGEFQNVYLSDEEYSKLQDKFQEACSGKIEDLSTYLKSKGKRYKSHYATILSWARRDGKAEPANEGNRSCANCDNEARGNCSEAHKAKVLAGGKRACGGWREVVK